MALIELLYPAAGNLYGEIGTEIYLKSFLRGAEFVSDIMGGEPYFVTHRPDIIFIGSMTEAHQENCIKLLTPYKERLFSLIEDGCMVFATGNAWELFADEIYYKFDDHTVEALGLIHTNITCDYFYRPAGKVLCKDGDITIVGYNARFSKADERADNYGCFEIKKGVGLYPGSKWAGVSYKGFTGTYMLGPMIVDNPDYLLSLLKKAGINDPINESLLSHARKARDVRLEEFNKPGAKY